MGVRSKVVRIATGSLSVSYGFNCTHTWEPSKLVRVELCPKNANGLGVNPLPKCASGHIHIPHHHPPSFFPLLTNDPPISNFIIESLVVDQVHCISTSGADFRPDYGASAPSSIALPVLVLLATLTTDARTDIQRHLSFNQRRSVFVDLGKSSLNIFWEVVQMTGKKNDLSSDLPFMVPKGELAQDTVPEKGIAFTRSLSQCEQLNYAF